MAVEGAHRGLQSIVWAATLKTIWTSTLLRRVEGIKAVIPARNARSISTHGAYLFARVLAVRLCRRLGLFVSAPARAMSIELDCQDGLDALL